MLRATPLEIPEVWGQYDPVNIQDVLLVFVNAGLISKAFWQCAAFDFEVFRSTRGVSRLVHTQTGEGNFETHLLSTWVTTCKPGLRGNTKGVLYYDKEKGWQRLHVLLDELQEGELQNSAPAEAPVQATATHSPEKEQGWSLKYYDYNTDIKPHLHGKPIGEGGFGQVFKACIGGQDVAIKIVRQSRGAASARGINALMVELNYVSRLQLGCPHIVKLLGMSHSEVGALCLVYEYANMGCMRCVPEEVPFGGAVRLFAQFAKGLQHMHTLSTVHGDLKPHNLLLHREGDTVRGLLADLGMARLVPISEQGVQGDRGTRGFVAPECHPGLGSQKTPFVTFATNVFSFGVTMGCVLTGAKPEWIASQAKAVHPSAPRAAIKAAVADLEGRVVREFDMHSMTPHVQRVVALIIKCCAPRPGGRPTMNAVLAALEEMANEKNQFAPE